MPTPPAPTDAPSPQAPQPLPQATAPKPAAKTTPARGGSQFSLPTARPATSAPAAGASQSPPPPGDTALTWKKWFATWPETIPHRGVVVNQLNEQLPFKAFMAADDMVLLERTNPDTLGSRYIFMPYSEIGLVKLTDPLKTEVFESEGFTGKLTT